MDDELFIEQCLTRFVGRLARKLEPYGQKSFLQIQTEHHRQGIIFRAHNKFRGGVWRDWVAIDWQEDGILPCKLWGFVDLTSLRETANVTIGGLTSIVPAVYAIVESASYVEDENLRAMSQIFVPIRKEVLRQDENRVTRLKFYLAYTDAFVEPLCVVPDIGGGTTDYFIVKNRRAWKEEFESWLETPDYESYFDDESDESDDDTFQEEDCRMGQIDEEDGGHDEWLQDMAVESDSDS